MTRLPVRRSIYRQFTQNLLVPLIAVLLLATAGTLLVGYQGQFSIQTNQRQQLVDAYANALLKPLWDCDDQTSRGIAESILQFSTIKNIELQSSCTGKTFHIGEKDAGSVDPADLFSKKLVFYDGVKREFVVGTLDISFHASSIFSDAFDILWRYLLISATMAIAIALGSMLAFRIIISRPLTAFRSAINAHIPARDCEELISSLPLAKRNDELTDVVKAYDLLMDKLSEQKKALLQQARQDALTGLGNRMVLEEALQAAMHRARRNRTHGYVLLIDLDEFKPINDTLGHAAGDFVLQTVAQRLLRAVRAVDTVTRLGGDEFVIIIDGHDPPPDLQVILDRISRELGAPLEYEGTPISIKASIGAACFPDEGVACDTLLVRADQAMYQEKITRKCR